MYAYYIILTVFISLIKIVISAVEPPDITFLTKIKNGKESHICVNDGNVLHSAVGWIYPIPNTKAELPEMVSNYVPDFKNEYDCNFAKKNFCNSRWQQMENWQNSKFDSYNFKPTLDTRWEELPTFLTSNSTEEFSNRIEITHTFQIGISVRAQKNAEIFLCEGWEPATYYCYYVNIGGNDNRQVFLQKFKGTTTKVLNKNETKLAKFKSDVGILSKNEWKNFVLSLDPKGSLNLFDMYKNTLLLNYTDKKPLLPIYLFVRSQHETALWKIHNNQYLYTNKSSMIQMGPTFSIPGKDLCVSLYVSMCSHCKMTFYMDNDGKEIIKTVFNEHDNDYVFWKEIRLLQHDIVKDKLKLYVETKYVNNTIVRNGFWAIDDIRVCSEDEIKINRLVAPIAKGIPKSQVSCQVLGLPTWRPTQHIFLNTSEEISYTSATASTIRLAWNSSDSHHEYQDYYLMEYQGKDLCGTNDVLQNKERGKSHGYLISRTNEITVSDLIPYTNYNITFSNVLTEKRHFFSLTTLPTEVPTKEELPKNLTMKVTDTTNEVQWNIPSCDEIYGPLFYKISVRSLENNYNKTSFLDIKPYYKFSNLKPFTNYTLEIKVARKSENLNVNNMFIKVIYNFTTSPGVPSVIGNLELYAIDKKRAQLRFDLPKDLKGNPESIQVRWCHPLFLTTCKTDIKNLTNCQLWKNKYCIDVENLILGYDYRFMVSLKNKNTHTFGAEASVIGTASNKVPGKPLNLTYEMINCDKKLDYCNLKINWVHPYQQNGTITMFDIILNETSYTSTTDTLKSIHEILRIKNYAYQSTYSYVVKYIFYNTPYRIAVRAVNDEFKGQFAIINIKTDDINNYIEQIPEFVKSTNETIIFKLPEFDWRLNSSTLIVIVQDYNQKKKRIDKDILNLEMFEHENQLCNQFGETWVAKSVELSNSTLPTVVIGDGTRTYSTQISKNVLNKPLQPDTEYCLTFTLINTYRNSVNVAVYHEKHLYTEPNYSAHSHKKEELVESSNLTAYLVPILFVLLLASCGAWLAYRYMKKRRLGGSNGEHIYESMPFDDYMVDAVSNQTYDKLVHS